MGTSTLSLAQQLAALPDWEREALLADMPDEEIAALEYDWGFWARPNQIAPTGRPWKVWLILAGRGFGKTRTAAELAIAWAREAPKRRIALVAETSADARDVIVEGESGIMACSPLWFRPKYEPSKRRLTWPNGSQATTYSGDDPEQLRGPQHHKALVDELAKYRYGQETWDNLELGLRLGDDPQAVVATTPRPIPLLKTLIADPSTVVTRGSTYENQENLAPTFIERVITKYEGTRLGRQELHAELLEDTPGALWTQVLLDETRVNPAQVPQLVRVAIALDPATTSQETSNEMGIVAGGRDVRGQGYVMQDASAIGTPMACARRAIQLYDDLKADVIVAEANNGGDWIGTVLELVARDMHRNQERSSATIHYKKVHASRGKHTRAEPISALYERHLVHHVGMFAQLEDQMTHWVPGMDSPDRLDAAVWLCTELLVQSGAPMQTRRFAA